MTQTCYVANRSVDHNEDGDPDPVPKPHELLTLDRLRPQVTS